MCVSGVLPGGCVGGGFGPAAGGPGRHLWAQERIRCHQVITASRALFRWSSSASTRQTFTCSPAGSELDDEDHLNTTYKKTSRVKNQITLKWITCLPVRPPGHHAQSNESNGFSLFNNVAIAARYARTRLSVSRCVCVCRRHYVCHTQFTMFLCSDDVITLIQLIQFLLRVTVPASPPYRPSDPMWLWETLFD